MEATAQAVPTVPPLPLEQKNAGLAAVLALLFGLFGLWGVGHIYIGKLTRGVVLLILGIIIDWILGFFAILSLLGGIVGSMYYRSTLPLGLGIDGAIQ